jgi:hypothetical protein
MKLCLAALALAAAPAFAQYPGQYPPGQYPQGGQYPPGQYPQGQGPGGPGISLPHRSGKKKDKPADKNAVPNFHQDGWVYSSNDKELQMATEDGRLITFKLDQNSKFTKDGNPATSAQAPKDTFIHVDAFEDEEWFLTAATIDVRKEPARKDTPDASERPSLAKAIPPPETKAAPAQDPNTPPDPNSLGAEPDAPGRPHLHHGKPTGTSSDPDEDMAPKPKPKPAETAQSADGSIDFTIGDEKTEVKKKPSAYGELIDRTKQWSETFSQGLPNFVCNQVTTRYVERSRSEGFEANDVLSAKVVYEDGKENYQEIMVGGKRTNKSMRELGGSTSTGEFASTLRSLFSDYVNAEFKFHESSTVGKTPVAIYDFKVLLPHSDWEIQMGSQRLHPAYSGSVWVDKTTGEVRHIELQADNIPKNFPGDTEATTLDYEPVRLGTSNFYLPVHSENLSCFRGTSICTKNVIDFRDYHKYSGESSVEFK